MRLSSRNLSNDISIEQILADIPLFTVGILAFCTLTFFVSMRRLNLLTAYLHAAVLAAFVAAILDLSQNLVRGRLKVNLGLGSAAAWPTVTASEIGFAVATGLRFIFFWTHAGEPPRAEASMPLALKGLHSGAWHRWGLVGYALQWTTLLLLVIVFVLQLAWRLDQNLTGFSPVYNTDAALEIILCAVFALKLGLNTWLCLAARKRDVILWYSGFWIALMLNFLVSIGGLLTFKFSETVLGRFLQALGYYTLLLFSLLFTFYPSSSQSAQPRSKALPTVPRISTFHVDGPSFPEASAATYADLEQGWMRPNRGSSSSRLSSWIVSRSQRFSNRLRFPMEDAHTRLRSFDDSEKRDSPSVITDVAVEGHDAHSMASTDYGNIEKRGFYTTNEVRENPVINTHLAPPVAPLKKSASPQTETPIYGLNGIQSKLRPPMLNLPNDDGSISEFTDRPTSGVSSLIRQQNELDKSIAALGLFNSPSETQSASIRSSISSVGQRSKTQSTSVKSEISLSNFPHPPWQSDAEIATTLRKVGSVSTFSTVRGPKVTVDDVPMDLQPPRMPAALAEADTHLSLPYSDTGSDLLVSARTPKFDSQGTQYDVTSFIGGLTTPRHKKEDSASTGMTDLSTGESPATIVTLNRSNSATFARPRYVGSPPKNSLIATIPARGKVGLPSNPQVNISNPQPLRSDSVMSTDYESPRPAPVLRARQ